jgi:hypothetical protein
LGLATTLAIMLTSIVRLLANVLTSAVEGA